MPKIITPEDVDALSTGGAILGGGGGGWSGVGRSEGYLALNLGKVELWKPEEANPDWKVVTVAALGAPTEPGKTKPMHFLRAAQLLRESGVTFDGVIAAENGGHNSFGGWIVAASLGLPVIDTPCDGRAHPTAMMGSMGLHRDNYKSVKAGVTEGCELICWGNLQTTSDIVRAQANTMKALIALVRDPVPVSYSKIHGAPGAISKAIDLGYAHLRAKEKGPDEAVKASMDFLEGEIISTGKVTRKISEARGGFDVGALTINSGSHEWELSYVNEYMTLEKDGVRLATFPDLITTFNDFGEPMTSASIKKTDRVYLVKVPKEKILIGHGNRYPENYTQVEAALGKPLIKYLEGYLFT
jgi:DUF917 family protein